MRARLNTLTTLLPFALLAGHAIRAEEAGSSPDEPAYRVVNIVTDFARYHAACRDADMDVRRARWDSMLEAKHPAFFRDAIYRGLEGKERDAYERRCVRRFWNEIAPAMAKIVRRTSAVEARLADVATRFLEAFPDADLATDFYLTVSFSFKGKVQEVDGRDVLALGIEAFEDEGPQPDITIAHEMFHLHHFRAFSRRGALYRALWTEGLAVYASALVVPGHRGSVYLGFSGARMNLCQKRLPELAEDLRRHAGENDQRRKRLYLGAEDNDTRVPPESGYYVGLTIAQRLAKETPVAGLAKLPPDKIFPLVEQELTRLATK